LDLVLNRPGPEFVDCPTRPVDRSELFSRSDRLTGFLRFIVEQTLEGHGGALKEQVLALD